MSYPRASIYPSVVYEYVKKEVRLKERVLLGMRFQQMRPFIGAFHEIYDVPPLNLFLVG